MHKEAERVKELLAKSHHLIFSRDGVHTPCLKAMPETCLGWHAKTLRSLGYPLWKTCLIGYDEGSNIIGEQLVFLMPNDGTDKQLKRGWE